jgi:hypothetical protein
MIFIMEKPGVESEWLFEPESMRVPVSDENYEKLVRYSSQMGISVDDLVVLLLKRFNA